MGAEVISLLSSSPAAALSPPVLAPSHGASSRTTQKVPSRALDYGVSDLTAESSSKVTKGPSDKISHGPIIGTKRASGSHSRQDDDFMFLSDDFDTTGDIDGNIAKKARTSASTNGIKKREDNILKRATSATFASNNRKPHSPDALNRWNWNSIADPIEHSSSPKKQTTSTKSSRLNLTSDPFKSSPMRESDVRQPQKNGKATQLPPNDPFNSPKGKGSAKAPVVIDLSDDDSEDLPRKHQPKKSKQNGAWDPISSSMPEAKTRSNHIIDSDSDDLPDLGDIDFAKLKSNRRFYSLTPSPPRKKTKTATKGPTAKGHTVKKTAEPKKTDEEREHEKRKKAEARELEKERKRVEKEDAKQQRVLEKLKEKALAEVNKLKTDRKVAVPEMIVDLPESLNVGMKAQIEELLKKMDVQFGYLPSRVENVVRWRRKVSSMYSEERGHWEPIPMRIMPEEHVMVIVEAADFVKLVLGAEDESLEAHVLKMKTTHPNNIILYLIEGLMPWMRKNKNIQNRRFASAVRALDVANNDAGAASSSQRRRRAAAQQEYIDEDIIEDALLSLQVEHGAMIHHTHLAVETAEWVAVFTQHISTIPYRRARDAAADAGFCMEAGQVRTGEDAKDTYVRMLQEVTRVTAPIAYGIAAKYATVAELVRGLEREGPLALENCRKCANRDGAFTDRVIGPAVSRRVYKIFTSRDPGSMDV
ncbi:hypothetical protein F4781DRAFT_309216 [Annulohypoxylon bovei var. microspora]|nr:hypothetical protein F4781DRAFT_309216 [Annulohypoxylon bovei var. microspora]